MSVGIRQARLRNEWAAWYPTVAVNTWIPAKTIARKVARQLLDSRRGERRAELPRWAPGPRILDARHFLFRGGRDSRPLGRHTRDGDPGREAGAQGRSGEPGV
jgi:hypothetical protein